MDGAWDVLSHEVDWDVVTHELEKDEKEDDGAALKEIIMALVLLAKQMREQHQESMDAFAKALREMAKTNRAIAEVANKKKRVVRGTDGRIEGIEAV